MLAGVLLSTISFEIQQGTTYYIVFDDENNNQGFDFSLTEGEEMCNPGDHISVDFTDVKEFQACHTALDADGDGNSWNADAADFKRDGNITYFALNSANQDRVKEDYLFHQNLRLPQVRHRLHLLTMAVMLLLVMQTKTCRCSWQTPPILLLQ